MKIRRVSFDHPDAVKLNSRVQLEYAERYGNGDEGDVTPLGPSMFEPPQGLYLVVYEEGIPVATGGWRSLRTRTTRAMRTATRRSSACM